MTEPRDVLDFWFGAPGDPGYGEMSENWFRGGEEFDRRCEVLRDAVEAAIAGGLDDWRRTPEGCLALVLLLDQLPRNLFRGKARAFAGDARALELARFARARGFDRALPVLLRMFLYMPFEHSEDMADQDVAVALLGGLGRPEGRDAALRHREIVARFGRFPHRNAALGRPSTPEEEAFAADPENRFRQ